MRLESMLELEQILSNSLRKKTTTGYFKVTVKKIDYININILLN